MPDTLKQKIRDILLDAHVSGEYRTSDAEDKLVALIQTEIEREEPEMNRKLQAVMIWIADYAYRKANPEGKMDTPSIVYEQVARDFGQFWDSLTPKDN